MNVSVHAALGVSPAQLIYGNALDLDRGLVYKNEDVHHEQDANITPTIRQYITQLLIAQSAILQIAKQRQIHKDLVKIQEPIYEDNIQG